MKASELIKRLQELIEEYGDKDVLPSTHEEAELDTIEYLKEVKCFWWYLKRGAKPLSYYRLTHRTD